MFIDSIYRYCKQQSNGLSGASAAADLGIAAGSFNSLTNWRQTSRFPSPELMRKIATYINWDFDDVFLAVNAARYQDSSLCLKLESQIKAPKKQLLTDLNNL
jgi:hypothetical protein